MAARFDIFGVNKIEATVGHNDGTNWIDIRMSSAADQFAATLFFDDPALADAYAAAINGVSIPVPEPAS